MIMHMDLDSFFVSAHRTIDKSLVNKPVVVGGRSDPFIFDKNFNKTKVENSNSGAFVPTLFIRSKEATFEEFFKEGEKIRGIVITASYEARKYGVKTGMSIREALERIPNLIVLTPNHKLYHHYSKNLREYLCEKIPVVEQYSIDEFFADVSGWIKNNEVLNFAKSIKQDIKDRFELPISIGIAKTKWIAKFATSYAKPEGIKIILPNQLDKYLQNTPIEKFPGIGKAFKKKLHSHKKFTLMDIKNSKQLLYSFGKIGKDLYDRVSGIDNDKVVQNRPRKSIGISRTFDPISDRVEIKRRLTILARHLLYMIAKHQYHPKTFHLSIRYEFAKSKKQVKLAHSLNEVNFMKLVSTLFDELDIHKNSNIIRLSISFRDFTNKYQSPYSIFDFEREYKLEKFLEETTKIREKYGIDIIRIANEIRED